jgi:hypothetical protein
MQVRFLAVRLIRYGVVGAFIGGGGLFAIEIDSQQARKNGNGHQDVNIKFRSFFRLMRRSGQGGGVHPGVSGQRALPGIEGGERVVSR